MAVGQRIQPLSGTDLARRAFFDAGKLKVQEIHTTDQHRIFMENVLLAPVWQGVLATQAAMLNLEVSNPRGCWPMDICQRTDTSSFWLCISNNGALITDWTELGGGGGGGGSTAAADIFFASTSPQQLTVQKILDYLLARVQALPTFGGAASLNVGQVAGTVAAGDDPRFNFVIPAVYAQDVLVNGYGAEFGNVDAIIRFFISRITALGQAAYRNIGQVAGTVAAGDDTRFVGLSVGNQMWLYSNCH